jgi:hypothetical protein
MNSKFICFESHEKHYEEYINAIKTTINNHYSKLTTEVTKDIFKDCVVYLSFSELKISLIDRVKNGEFTQNFLNRYVTHYNAVIDYLTTEDLTIVFNVLGGEYFIKSNKIIPTDQIICEKIKKIHHLRQDYNYQTNLQACFDLITKYLDSGESISSHRLSAISLKSSRIMPEWEIKEFVVYSLWKFSNLKLSGSKLEEFDSELLNEYENKYNCKVYIKNCNVELFIRSEYRISREPFKEESKERTFRSFWSKNK